MLPSRGLQGGFTRAMEARLCSKKVSSVVPSKGIQGMRLEYSPKFHRASQTHPE